MATTPQIQFRDSSGYTTNLVFSTNQEAIFVYGKVELNIATIQVSVNGGAFVTDPNLIKLDIDRFTFPNPNVYPEGQLLDLGVNTIQFRVIDILGKISPAATVNVTRVREISLVGVQIPSGIRARRNRNTVTLLSAIPLPIRGSSGNITATPDFLGFNLYASSSPGGTTGYFRVNESLITEADSTFEEDVLSTTTEKTTWNDGKLQNLRIVVQEEDEFENVLGTRLDVVEDVSTYFDSIRFTSTVESYVITKFSKFVHDRAGGAGIINSDQFVNVNSALPLYYVFTGVYFDPSTSQEIETPYSQEVLGTPLTLDTSIRDLPGRQRLQIVTDYVTAIVRVNQAITLNPGSTTRDVSIDPFSSEADRLWFLLDFIHRSQSFLTLLQIDDANGDGISDPVSASSYKTALRAAVGYTSDEATQNLINQQFDKLAKNVNKDRLPGRAAVGQAVVYTPTRPTADIPIPAGSFVSTEADTVNNLPAVRFRIGGSYIISAANADAYYNFNTKLYELTVDISAEAIGENGNRPAGSIKSINIPGVFVKNTEATVFGTDIQSNAELAAWCILSFASVDTGTEGGYYQTAAEQSGIIKAKVVKSGDPLMMRDWDPIRKKHIGGKVDLWVQGLRERTITENFAFQFEIARDILCQVIDLVTLTFRVLDSRVTPQNPIIEILNNPAQGLGVRNATLGADYDLTGVIILDYNTFRINTAIPQPVTFIDDVILADYRFRSINKFFFTFQPVRRVVSVVGAVSGPLVPNSNYLLYKTEDPLLEGESTIAKDYLQVTQFAGKPSGSQFTVNDEQHVLIGFVQEPLDSIGINTKTIRVFNQARTVEYNGPETTLPDFDIIEGTPTKPAKIVRTASSVIANGQLVSVDYVHDENFNVTYVINDLLQQLQQVVNVRRHVTADVLVKQTIDNPIDIETTVQLLTGATKDRTDPGIRSNVSIDLDKRLIGQGAAQSDVINAVDSSAGVDFEIVPLAKMAYSDGSRRIREGILSTHVRLPTLDIGAQRAYILTNPLTSPTTDGGGLPTEHHGVFQDDVAMTMASVLTSVASGPNQAYIIGADGAVINGYSDDATLTAAGFTTPEARAAERLRRTANHIVVALVATVLPPDDPGNHSYACSYVVRGDKGAKDFAAAAVEFLSLGELTITYSEVD